MENLFAVGSQRGLERSWRSCGYGETSVYCLCI